MADRASLRIAVIGAGPSGLATGHELLAHGFTNFTIFEATDAVGGTWHIHTYPGLACDVGAHSYTFTYRPNPDWTQSFVDQPEIEAYLQQCAREFGLEPHIRLDTRLTSAHYHDEGCWTLTSEAGETFEADVVINAMGNQHTPLYPDVPGMDGFRGRAFHATRWDHSIELEGKRGLVSDDFYPALLLDHVELVPEGLRAVRPEGITTASGREIDADVILYCTGYRILDFDRIEVIGLDGQSLAGVMEKAPEAYKGIAAPQFPNYFFAVGPNGLVLNVPYFVTIEKNIDSIVRLLREKQAADAAAIAVKPELNRRYNDWLLEEFPKYSWGNASCNSYYRSEDGRAPFLFPDDFALWEKLHGESGLHEYDVAGRPDHA
jgi:cation diffusion facilitator CzcD-associated flavoprotein CzcO